VSLKDILEEKRFNFDIANDGFKAIEMIKRISPLIKKQKKKN